ncbi:MAG: hypothetical protein BGN86_11220 [Caulobacterales bacterium 68-7]|nr:MBL fold metallo-hydrolase [Caulobacterales bacterium]OJU11643.1 MAG: hypothetical protein BGN86_11220 [Caulobacterales bacterium 68-7]
MRGIIMAAALAVLAAGGAQAQTSTSDHATVRTPSGIELYRVFPGFRAETRDEQGTVTGYVGENPWGQYTAYLMATNAKGQRTFRIEHNLPRGDGRSYQGSSMYLLEGRDRALLIDTANPAQATEGVNDLKTVVRYLLGHESDGAVRARPLEFVVANTHSHGDHIGENKRMNDRTVYYMDGDWPANAPANYVPIREGGGATTHGSGQAVGEIDLGDRKVSAVAMPPHTPGSTGYLDAENQMLFSGDAIGTGYVWIQWAPVSRYAEMTKRLQAQMARYPQLAVFGAHFYQYDTGLRRGPPLNGAPADNRYIREEAELAQRILDGTVEGEPYSAGRETVWATNGSAQIVYSLANIYAAGEAPSTPWHSVRVPSTLPAAWQTAPALKAVLPIKAELHQIRGPKGEVLQLIKGSRASLVIGAASTAPGLEAFVRRLVGAGPLEWAPMADGSLKEGAVIDLGVDSAGRPLRLEARTLGAAVTLIDSTNRVLFAGSALGVQGADSGWSPPGGAAAYKAALTTWRAKTDGRYDVIYTAGNHQWFTSPAYVDELGKALDKVIAGGAAATASKVKPGLMMVKSEGGAEVVASVDAGTSVP